MNTATKALLDLPWTVCHERQGPVQDVTLLYATVRNAKGMNVARFPDTDFGIAVATLLAEAPERMSLLESLIANLPSTVDGITIVPGMKLYCPVTKYDHLIVTAVHTHNAVSLESVDVMGRKVNEWESVPVGNCYSTREAAIASKGSCI